MMVGAYESLEAVGGRLRRALPPVLFVKRAAWDSPLLGLLHDEAAKDQPGQAAEVDRLLDVLLIAVLRAWFSRPDAREPAWYRSQADPMVGRALDLLHKDPAHPWTLERLAGRGGPRAAGFQDRSRSASRSTLHLSGARNCDSRCPN